MPKVQKDQRLHGQINALVARCGGSKAEAARRLGASKASLGRFLRSGGALERTKERYRVALERLGAGSETGGSGAADPSAQVTAALVDQATRDAIRRMCDGLVVLLDAYEARLGAPSRVSR